MPHHATSYLAFTYLFAYHLMHAEHARTRRLRSTQTVTLTRGSLTVLRLTTYLCFVCYANLSVLACLISGGWLVGWLTGNLV
ncbi:hypothetical protein IWX90DRAFT_446451, partial [Phyllosticta citrichinensis]